MKTTKIMLNLAVLLGFFSAKAHAQFPNAWQINDNSTATGSTLNYYTNLTAAQFDAAITNGWRFTITCRMVTNYGSANGAMYLLFGDGTNRYGFNLNLDSSGRLVVNPLVGSQVVVTPDASTATNYHTHELDFDPATQQVTYFFDGAPLANWSAQAINADAGEPVWGSVSSADKGEMNFHRVQFEIIGQGTVASYYAGFDGNPAVAPSPTTQGWTRFSGGVSIPEGPVSPDGLAAPPLVTTLAASALSASNATLGAVLYPGSGPTVYYFEYGTTTNYGNFSATNTV
ncbi:MAG TPA: hypothetical protein VMJ12_05765, partial [Candidatus Acidoferrales bacterium]|nr:hypothetical protein [Candidatus Acidoferrales bacterium]